MGRPFSDRRDAGRQLAEALAHHPIDDPLVLGLPRGGVPVAFEVALALGARLDVIVARKIGAPANPEFGIGAIAEGGGAALASDTVRALRISDDELQWIIEREQAELHRRVATYRGERRLPAATGRDVVLVDDGLATGVTAEAALRSLRAQQPARLLLAVPVGPPETVRRLVPPADEVVCVVSTRHLTAVGAWYQDFTQTTDDEVLELLAGGAA